MKFSMKAISSLSLLLFLAAAALILSASTIEASTNPYTKPDESWISINGKVKSVTPNTGLRSLKVEVEEMAYNPLDDEGYQKVEVGDVVRVTGSMDKDFFEGRELVADAIVTVSR